jgi:hypothetical protein
MTLKDLEKDKQWLAHFRAIRKNLSFISWKKFPLVYSPISRPERIVVVSLARSLVHNSLRKSPKRSSEPSECRRPGLA